MDFEKIWVSASDNAVDKLMERVKLDKPQIARLVESYGVEFDLEAEDIARNFKTDFCPRLNVTAYSDYMHTEMEQNQVRDAIKDLAKMTKESNDPTYQKKITELWEFYAIEFWKLYKRTFINFFLLANHVAKENNIKVEYARFETTFNAVIKFTEIPRITYIAFDLEFEPTSEFYSNGKFQKLDDSLFLEKVCARGPSGSSFDFDMDELKTRIFNNNGVLFSIWLETLKERTDKLIKSKKII